MGKSVYTQWLDARGTIEVDLTVTRTAPDRFLIEIDPFAYSHCGHWLLQHMAREQFVTVTDTKVFHSTL